MRGDDDESSGRWHTGVLGFALAGLVLTGCGSPTIVNTGEPWSPAETPAPSAQLPQHANNRDLADASDFYVATENPKVYRFATPSGRWTCEMVPHTSAGCRPSTSSQLSITGAPTSVPGPDGAPTAPNTIIIGRGDDVGFVASADVADSTVTGPTAAAGAATVPPLPFGKVLQVAGFRCNVQEVTGVSCGSESSGKGFTFSADGYTPVYTDIPH